MHPTIRTNLQICWKVSLPYVKYLNISFFQVLSIHSYCTHTPTSQIILSLWLHPSRKFGVHQDFIIKMSKTKIYSFPSTFPLIFLSQKSQSYTLNIAISNLETFTLESELWFCEIKWFKEKTFFAKNGLLNWFFWKKNSSIFDIENWL